MEVQATTQGALECAADTTAIGVFDGERVAHDLPGGELTALLARGEARTTPGSLALWHAGPRRVLLAGLGPRQRFDAERARTAAAAVAARSRELTSTALCWELPHRVPDAVAAGLVEGTLLRLYRFDRYRPPAAPDGQARPLRELVISAHHDVSAAVAEAEVVARAQNRARDLANTAANELTPEALGDYALSAAEHHQHLSARVLTEEEIVAAGMGAFAAVAQGSARPARLIELRLDRPEAVGPQLGLVGKAVTFDSGGLSLKPPLKMHEMKFDMAGGAAVIEAMAALAELGVPVRAVAVIGAAENLPGPTSVKPGDVVRAADGTTIEVNNTDAEGRLILADCLLHARALGAERLIDVATLTGGVVTALGSVMAGMFANHREWGETVRGCGELTGELLWPLPLHPEYAAMVKGRYAQLTNLTVRREATAIAAAEFLHHFVGGTPWAHVDIAGTAWDVPRAYLVGKGATGFGVRLLVAAAQAAAELRS